MYYYTLQIVIINRNPLLQRIAAAAKPQERFTHKISVCDGPYEAQIQRGDIVIFDLQTGCPTQMRARFGDAAKLILCASRQEMDAMEEKEAQAVDRFWETPLEERLTTLRFQHILEDIQRDKELRLTQHYLDAAINTIPDMVWFKSKGGLHLKVNQAFCQTVGKTQEDVTGKDHCYIWDVSREDFHNGEFVCRETEEQVMREKRTCQFYEKVKSQHGMRQFKTYKSPLFDEDGTIMGTVGVGHDVTDLENMGAEMEILLRSMPYAILVRNGEGEVINVNPRFEKYFGVSRDSILGRQYREWSEKAFEDENSVNNEGYVEAKVRYSERTLEIHEEPIYDVFQNVVGGLSIYRDVTVERALEQQILYNSNTDFMTGLYNRRCFYQFVNKNRGDRPVSLLYLDLDCFKKVNDTFGHGAGDDALIQTARLLRESFGNEFITRFGGDEFLIAILGPCQADKLKSRAEGLLMQMQQAFKNSEHLRLLTASIGIAQTCDPKMDIDVLIRQSDTALYEAKQSGRACCKIYSQEENPIKC